MKWYKDGYLPKEKRMVDQAMEYYTQHFETNLENPGLNSRAIPNDYAALQNDQQFLNLLSIMISSRKGLAGGKMWISEMIIALIQEIDRELDRV